MSRYLMCLVTGLLCIALNLHAASLKAIAVTQHRNQTSFFLTFNGPFTHKVLILTNPNRVVIDFKNTHLATNLNQSGLSNRLVQKIRAYAKNAKNLRLVWDLQHKVQVRSAPWKPIQGSYGLRLDLIVTNSALVVPSKPVIITPVSKTNLSISPAKMSLLIKKQMNNSGIKPSPVKLLPQKSLRDVVVVLDAGHGGKDSGARGPRRTLEKHVVLAIALKLKKLIDKQPGMRAVLTRSGDYYLGLRERLDKARQYNGDVFVAIHADAFSNPHSHGASVFALSQMGATSEAARWIAEKENYSELGGVNLGDLDDRNGVVRSVLIDLSQTATINSSLQMGGRVLSQLGSFTRLHNAQVEQARFIVLKSPDIPSILVETGFISNPAEERYLTNPRYQQRLSEAIFKGLKGYFWENPPHGSRIEALVVKRIHIVRDGETLPKIAAKYHVSIAHLQRMNSLGNQVLNPGQKIVISA